MVTGLITTMDFLSQKYGFHRVTEVSIKILTPLEGTYFHWRGSKRCFLQFKTLRRVIYIPLEGFRYLSRGFINPLEGFRYPSYEF